MSYPQLHALYATVETPSGPRTYRIGLPATRAVIMARHARFDNAHHRNRRRLRLTLRGASYPLRWLEVREVDAQGRGLGAERHWGAYGVPVNALSIEPDGTHRVTVTGSSSKWRATGKTAALLTTRTSALYGYGSNPTAAILDARREARRKRLI